MVGKLTVILLGLALASTQAAILRPPGPILTNLVPSPIIPSLPPYVNVNPIVDVQAYTALSCGCGSPVPPCGCGATLSPCGCGAGVSPCGCGATVSPCGCGAPIAPCTCSAQTVDCRVPTCTSLPPVTCGCGGPTPCGCGAPVAACSCGVPTVAYSSYPTCGCGLTTPLLPPLAPVIGCTKYLRQVCVQPPFL